MKEKLMEELLKADLPKFEIQYILVVIEFIDSNMAMLDKNKIDYGMVTNKMLELVQSINSCNTGVQVIDEIIDLRKKNAYDQIAHLGESAHNFVENKDFRTNAYGNVQNYIAIISSYGGLYKYVCEIYKEEIEKVTNNTMKNK